MITIKFPRGYGWKSRDIRNAVVIDSEKGTTTSFLEALKQARKEQVKRGKREEQSQKKMD